MVDAVIMAAAVIAVCFVLLYATSFMFRIISRRSSGIHWRFLRSFLRCFIVIGGIYVYLSQFDATRDIGKTFVQSGALLIAIATFASQKMLGNVVAGMVLSTAKPFSVGDKISIQAGTEPIVTGIVMGMTLRHVMIQMIDGKVVTVANGMLDSYFVINENTIEHNGRPFSMECSFDCDVAEAIRLMEEEINKHPLVLQDGEEAAKVTCSALTPNGFELKAILFTRTIGDSFTACSDLRMSVFSAWKAAGIEVPYQTVTVLKDDK